MSLDDRIAQARADLVRAVDAGPSRTLLEDRAAIRGARRQHRRLGVAVAVLVAVGLMSLTVVGGDAAQPTDVAAVDGETPERADPHGSGEDEPAGPADQPAAADPADDPPAEQPPAPAEPPCPNFVADPQPDDDPYEPSGDYEQLERDQTRYFNDAETAQQYGSRHPEDFVGVRFLNTPHVRIAVAFTQNLAVHCEQLRSVLEHPEDFELWYLPWTDQELRRVQAEVNTAAGEMLRSSSISFGGPVQAHLRADGEALARDLLARHGDMLDLHVGLHRFPRERASSPARPCTTEEAVDSLPGVEITLALDEPSIARGRDGTGVLTITNRRLERITVSQRPLDAFIRTTDATLASVREPLPEPSIGYPDVEIAPGESAQIDVRYGTAACDLTHGYALPPGEFHVATTVHVRHGTTSTAAHSPPAALEITP